MLNLGEKPSDGRHAAIRDLGANCSAQPGLHPEAERLRRSRVLPTRFNSV